MNETKPGDAELVAFCGLYCGECGAHKRGRCPGCAANVKATWCGVRSCCMEKNHLSCADCAEHSDPRECGKFNHWISRLFGSIFRSDRAACVRRIREVGRETYADEMASNKRQTIKRS